MVDGTIQFRSSDYFTRDELVQFKKGKGNKIKKRRLRKKPISEQMIPMDDVEMSEADLGSRRQRENCIKSKRIEDVAEALEKRDNYNKAVEKAETDSKWLFEEEDDEDELYKSLARTRKLAQRERSKREEIIAEQVEQAVQDKREAKKKDTRLTFNTTTEFIRRIPKAPHGEKSEIEEPPEDPEGNETSKTIVAIRKKQKEREKRIAHRSDEMDIEIEESQSEQTETPSSPVQTINPIEELMGAEPLASNWCGGYSATSQITWDVCSINGINDRPC